MTALGITYRVDDAAVLAALRRVADLGADATPIMRGLATIGENSTRERFTTQTAPDGTRWTPSLRARLIGGRTLTHRGHLGNSITSDSARTWAEWGTNMVYGAIHQTGGVIRPKSASALRFRLANGSWRTARQVTIPSRPFLGISDADRTDMLDYITSKIERALGAS
ncbi:MAG: phage virion morphogenesis protein [Nitrospirota bacterium]|nr:phage virion morphogenesis protein [Nitrospirota bacterium]